MAGGWFSLGTPVSSTNKAVRHDIAEILLKMTLSIISHKSLDVHVNNKEEFESTKYLLFLFPASPPFHIL